VDSEQWAVGDRIIFHFSLSDFSFGHFPDLIS